MSADVYLSLAAALAATAGSAVMKPVVAWLKERLRFGLLSYTVVFPGGKQEELAPSSRSPRAIEGAVRSYLAYEHEVAEALKELADRPVVSRDIRDRADFNVEIGGRHYLVEVKTNPRALTTDLIERLTKSETSDGIIVVLPEQPNVARPDLLRRMKAANVRLAYGRDAGSIGRSIKESLAAAE